MGFDNKQQKKRYESKLKYRLRIYEKNGNMAKANLVKLKMARLAKNE